MPLYFQPSARVLGASVAAVTAPADTNENILATINVPILPINAVITYRLQMSQTNNANAKTARFRLGGIGGTDFITGTSLASQARYLWDGVINNRGAVNSQAGAFISGATALSSSTITTGTIDTSAATTLVITAQKATGGDTITLEYYYVQLWLP
jgi:hypothetical protein